MAQMKREGSPKMTSGGSNLNAVAALPHRESPLLVAGAQRERSKTI
jgi:hypothetical protein